MRGLANIKHVHMSVDERSQLSFFMGKSLKLFFVSESFCLFFSVHPGFPITLPSSGVCYLMEAPSYFCEMHRNARKYNCVCVYV